MELRDNFLELLKTIHPDDRGNWVEDFMDFMETECFGDYIVDGQTVVFKSINPSTFETPSKDLLYVVVEELNEKFENNNITHFPSLYGHYTNYDCFGFFINTNEYSDDRRYGEEVFKIEL
jgi:hypothetical protein